MNKCDFDNNIMIMRKHAPILFELEHDKLATKEDIIVIEEYYGLKLPQSYIEFVEQYGGGYFGTTVILSCDSKGEFYIIDNISKDFIKTEKVLPIIDFETGDYLAFVIEEGICKEELVVYSHENPEMTPYKSNFYNAVIEYGFGHLR